MNRTVKNKNTPHMKPVEKAALSEKHFGLRLAAVILLLAIGASALAYAFQSLFSAETGWTEIKASSSADVNSGEEFVFMYLLGADGAAAPAESKAITRLYTDALVHAYRIFNNDGSFDGVKNVYDINQHPNEVIEVDAVLYSAFSAVQKSGNRYLYLAPAYAVYDNIFYCIDDSELMNYDPMQNEDIREDFGEIAAYAGDPEAVNLQLLGDNKVRLYVSEPYLEYAEEECITDFIDFYWMKNAFIIDYLAEVMTENQYTAGAISSYDGFVRNLDDSGMVYSFNLYDRVGQDIYPAAVMQYDSAISIVSLRNYPLNSLDSRRCYEMRNGEVRTAYLDITDGCEKTAADNLISCSRNMGCSELLLKLCPIYITDSLQEERIAGLTEEEIYSVYFRNRVLFCNDPSVSFTDLYNSQDISYTVSFTGKEEK